MKHTIHTLTVHKDYYSIDLDFPAMPGNALDLFDGMQRQFCFDSAKKRDNCAEFLRKKGIDFRTGQFQVDDNIYTNQDPTYSYQEPIKGKQQ